MSRCQKMAAAQDWDIQPIGSSVKPREIHYGPPAGIVSLP